MPGSELPVTVDGEEHSCGGRHLGLAPREVGRTRTCTPTVPVVPPPYCGRPWRKHGHHLPDLLTKSWPRLRDSQSRTVRSVVDSPAVPASARGTTLPEGRTSLAAGP